VKTAWITCGEHDGCQVAFAFAQTSDDLALVPEVPPEIPTWGEGLVTDELGPLVSITHNEGAKGKIGYVVGPNIRSALGELREADRTTALLGMYALGAVAAAVVISLVALAITIWG